MAARGAGFRGWRSGSAAVRRGEKDVQFAPAFGFVNYYPSRKGGYFSVKEIYSALCRALSAGQGAVLCSVIASEGSTPRGAGAKMLVTADGSTVGTVGGGAVEYRCTALAGELLQEKRSRFQSYRLSAGEIADIGMICGGSVELFLQYLDPADRGLLPLAEQALSLVDSGREAWLITAIDGEGRWRWGLWDKNGPLTGLADLPRENVVQVLGSRPRLVRGDVTLYGEPLSRPGTVYLFGGGHVGRALAPILAMTDFRVVVCDQRPDAASRAALPQAAEVYCLPYEDAFAHLPPVTAADYVVIMTPGHQADFEVLRQALATPARYIGCIGSRRKVAATREKLLAAGFPAEEIDRIWSPIGLPIGGDTPAEIAVSIAAQLIACRSGRLEERGKRHGG